MRTVMTCFLVGVIFVFASAVIAATPIAATPIAATPIAATPQIDGRADEPFWQQIKPVTINDAVANIPLQLRAAHDGENVYFLVSFPDADESRLHRALVWKPELNSYQNGPTREDSFVFKWAMSGLDADLSLKSDRPYRADIWYWKAHRTDHSGYADDKIQHYTTTRNKKAMLLLSQSGKVFYLQRNGDRGESAYKPKLQAAYTEDLVAKYDLVQPSGSRADVRAKGHWQDGRWTIEFARKLQTGHDDDLQMSLDGQYLFGVSRYEIAGREPEPESESDVPLFGSGDVGELLQLSFQP